MLMLIMTLHLHLLINDNSHDIDDNDVDVNDDDDDVDVDVDLAFHLLPLLLKQSHSLPKTRLSLFHLDRHHHDHGEVKSHDQNE